MTFQDFSKTEEYLSLIEKLRRKLKIRGFEGLEDIDLQDEIESAIEAVNDRRRFVPNKKMFFEPKYKNIVLRLCIASCSKMGAEGELAHSENGTSRTYAGAAEYPNDILKEIIPLAKVKGVL